MKVKAIAPWFGGKRTMAPAIAAQLGEHGQYFEPFCGSMAVLFAKAPSQKETVNDLHGGLICLARVLADELQAPQLYDRLQRTLFSEDILGQARNLLTRHPDPAWMLRCDRHGEDPKPIWYCPHCLDVLDAIQCAKCGMKCEEMTNRRADANMLDYAYWYFIACWMGRNGTAGTARLDYQIAVRWTKGGGSPTVRWRNCVDSIPAWHERLRNVVILRRDAFSILDKFEDVKETAIYVDPPYPAETRGNGKSIKNGSGGRYLHEFNHEGDIFGESDDPSRLARILRGYRDARIVVSSYDCPRIRELYEGWTFVSHTRQKHLHAQNGRGARPKDAPEVLIINGEEYPKPAG